MKKLSKLLWGTEVVTPKIVSFNVNVSEPDKESQGLTEENDLLEEYPNLVKKIAAGILRAVKL